MRPQYCTQCGRHLEAGETVCAACGAEVAEMTSVGDGPAGEAAAAGAPSAAGVPQPEHWRPSPRPGIGYMYLSAEGRISRAPYWLWQIPLFVFNGFIEAAAQADLDARWYGLYLVTTIPSLFLSVKRAHDRGWSGWFVMLGFIPLINFWVLIELGFLRGTPGPNAYGPDPLAE